VTLGYTIAISCWIIKDLTRAQKQRTTTIA